MIICLSRFIGGIKLLNGYTSNVPVVITQRVVLQNCWSRSKFYLYSPRKILPNIQFFCSKTSTNMPKKPKNREGKSSKHSEVNKSKENIKSKGPLKTNPEGSILMEIYAKPGAKQNSIVEVTEEGINVQINAPPVEGSANTELVKYMASFLGLKSSNVTLERGHKSRNKILRIGGGISKAAIIQKLNAELPDGSRLILDEG